MIVDIIIITFTILISFGLGCWVGYLKRGSDDNLTFKAAVVRNEKERAEKDRLAKELQKTL